MKTLEQLEKEFEDARAAANAAPWYKAWDAENRAWLAYNCWQEALEKSCSD